MAARVLGGRYQLHTMLGRGGMATVWAGLDTRLDRTVAVKIVEAGASADVLMVQHLDREARTIARLAHPNIVAVYDVGIDRGLPYLVMELVEGADLQRRLAQGPLPVRDAIRICMQVCDALEAAHEAGLVHRDIKPDNILLTRSGAVKVCDFGIAALHPALTADATGRTVVGTSEYMAPEQAVGGPVDARTDLYALGCVLYAMLTGDPPFTGTSPDEVLRQQVHQAPVPLSSRRPDVPSELDALAGQLLAKNAYERPANAHDVRARLRRLEEHGGGLGSTPARPVVPSASDRPTGILAPAQGSAAVVTPTRALSAAWDGVSDDRPARARMRLGPAGIAAVAVATAAVTALVVMVLANGQTAQPAAGQGTGAATTGSVATTSPAAVDPAGAGVDAVRGVVQAQLATGQLSSTAANDLTDRLTEIDRRLVKGDADKAADELADLRDDLAQLRDDRRITESAYAAIVQSLDQLAQVLPSSSRGHNN